MVKSHIPGNLFNHRIAKPFNNVTTIPKNLTLPFKIIWTD